MLARTLVGLLFLSSGCAFSARAQENPKATTFFESKIRPLLAEKCLSCHSSKAKIAFAGLRLDTAEGVLRGADSGAVVVPGKPAESRLMKALSYDAAPKMPPTGKLKAEEIEAFRSWIEMGAPWPADQAAGPAQVASRAPGWPDNRARHWAWQPVRTQQPPEVRKADWPLDVVDRFILAKLEEAGLSPQGEAGRPTWLRRVSIDLTGLPPTLDEMEAFDNDHGAQAYEKAVDRLLASPAFGQRWGRHWLDQTYYADNIELGRRIPALHAWRYRDYVIDSFNRDVPYDRFILEQLAGEQLEAETPGERRRNIIATGFLALGPWALVTADKEQLRMDVVDLQLDMVGKTFLGLTLGCARCHDHKFDPVKQRDYYAMAGILRSTQTLFGRMGLTVFTNVNTVPLPELPEEMVRRAEETRVYDAKLASARAKLKDLKARREPLAQKSPEREALDKAVTEAENDVKLLEFLPPFPPTAHAVQDVDTPSDCRINVRGNPHQLGDEVPRGVVSMLLKGAAPDIADWRSGRMELAKWIAGRENALTARVMVNRVWHHLFGAGLVRSIDNFGLRGDPPSHPELIDYLAAEFVDCGWSVKKLVRRLALTRVYRMSSAPDPRAMEKDPENRWLWRMNRRRLEAETIRDAMLAVSGALDLTPGGPSLPLWVPANVNLDKPEFLKDDAKLDPASTRRRSVYLPVLRKSQLSELDVLNLFNFPDVNQITGARAATTIPTQALFLLNAGFVRAQARALAESLLADRGAGDEQRIERLIRRVYNRRAERTDLERLLAFVRSFSSIEATSAGDRDVRLEAWTRLCHSLFASNEFLYRS